MYGLYHNTEAGEGIKKGGPSRMADAVSLGRWMESMRPEDERICYDPYAVRFISPETLEFFTRHPAEVRAMVERLDRTVPGMGNSIAARVRYIDDIVRSSLRDGLEQLVILGAGYDTRAYRMEGLDKIKVFEVDLPATQEIKKEKVAEIFGSLPGHVAYVPVDITADKLGQRLAESGYDRFRKTLFIAEGLFMYLPPGSVDETLAFIVDNSGRGSAIAFDYISQSVIDGTCELEAGKHWQKNTADAGEPCLFGIKDGAVEAFLTQRGFRDIENMTSEDYKKAYFHGKNAGRVVNSLHSFAYARVKS